MSMTKTVSNPNLQMKVQNEFETANEVTFVLVNSNLYR